MVGGNDKEKMGANCLNLMGVNIDYMSNEGFFERNLGKIGKFLESSTQNGPILLKIYIQIGGRVK